MEKAFNNKALLQALHPPFLTVLGIFRNSCSLYLSAVEMLQNFALKAFCNIKQCP